ncbi:hypothetical protein N0V90_008406 [Kalmusia sp. IMI 367209]|nr:hypothetical protein N0V90_008406 [Kalmusia sp. IMI 367209]
MSITTITNIQIFDGHDVLETRSSLSFDTSTGLIVPDADATTTIDGTGCTLLPGLWDTHVHLSNHTPQSVVDSLTLCKNLIACGITTAVDCGNLPADHHTILQKTRIAPDILFANNFATSTGSVHSKFAMATSSSIVDSVSAAATFVSERVAQGAHFIKIVADVPGPSQAIINQLSKSAHEHGKKTIVHASRHAAFLMALRAEPPVSIITHVPMDEPLTLDEGKIMKEKGIISVPTLIMMRTISASGYIPGSAFPPAMQSAKALHEAGVPMLVGTDSNQSPIAGVRHGEALWTEMELLEEVGMTSAEVLRAATGCSAELLGIEDRGVVEVGRRADLVLVKGFPSSNVQDLKNVMRVWKAGTEVFSSEPSDAKE